MTNFLSRRSRILILILIPLLVSFACLPGGPAATSTPEAVIVQADVVFGPGPFIYPDTQAGLADLSSYKASLTLAFDGSRDGQPEQWSKTYVMLSTQEPALRLLTIEKTGELSDTDLVFMAQADGAVYERRGENACNAAAIDPGNTLFGTLEPAGFLTGVIGAEEAGTDRVNDLATDRYTFDERAFGQLGLAQSAGEMWVATDGGFIVRYLVTTTGAADYFGEGIEGTLRLAYELTDVNGPLTIELPADCPAGMVDAPLLPDSSNVLNMPGVLTYDTASSPAEAAAFYEEQIPNLGWALIREPAITETNALMEFTQGDQNLTVIITSDAGVTTVNILLERFQE